MLLFQSVLDSWESRRFKATTVFKNSKLFKKHIFEIRFHRSKIDLKVELILRHFSVAIVIHHLYCY